MKYYNRATLKSEKIVDDVKHLEICGIWISRMRSLAVGRGRMYICTYARTYMVSIDINKVGARSRSPQLLVKCLALWGERERNGRHYSRSADCTALGIAPMSQSAFEQSNGIGSAVIAIS